ncbi:MAG: DegT/DnrJ/EryC1/StrS family aminotransferase [Bacillota bacterium]|nr:DegT/DnrJ/EryC1/StrS family aminotransferase [Bacillota bacterium]
MINVTKTYLPNIEKYKEYIDDIFESGWLTNNGQFVKKLEKRLKEYLGVKNLILVSNGTLALQVAYRALGLKGEVLTTPFSFVATTSTLVWEGLKPKFVDIDSETLNMDYRRIEPLITDKTSAIVPVHVFGNACEVEEIHRIAEKNNLKVIYDAAHAFDVKYKGESLLNYGDISTISFHSTKIFHTIEGGAIIVKDNELYEKIKLMINFGISGPDRVECLGINTKMNEFQAAMGLCILDDMEGILENRRRVTGYYREYLPKGLQLQKHNENCSENYAYFPVVFDSENTLLSVQEGLRENDIYARRYFYPSLDTLSYIKEPQDVPISNSISKRILCLPIYDSLSESELSKIITILKEGIR